MQLVFYDYKVELKTIREPSKKAKQYTFTIHRLS